MEGFGFFGAMDVWWAGSANLVDDAWAAQVLDDLGISIWRNEYYPPADDLAEQDADWDKQKPVIQTLKRIADASKVPMKVLLTVWSPPSTLKCKVQKGSGLPIENTAPQSTKRGNTLCWNSRDAFAAWLIAGLQLYKDIGVDVYGISLQNEPYFAQFYNSCVYSQDYYAEVLGYVGPKIKAAFPDVKIFGAENMLAMEVEGGSTWFYTRAIRDRKEAAAARSALDVLAVHGYNDGVVPTATSQMSTFWAKMYLQFSRSMNKPLWMTETSGYADTWAAGKGSDGLSLPGAADLAYSMFAALYYGHVSAWVWWQGSSLGGLGPHSLMAGSKALGKRYYVSKQFFRFIRPGARMVKTISADSSVLAVAFEHTDMDSFTVILINSSKRPKNINLTGTNVPSRFTMYTTSATENCVDKGTVSATGVVLSPKTVNTLVSGNTYESRE